MLAWGMAMALAGATLVLFTAVRASSAIYTYLDAQGVVHFTDTPPSDTGVREIPDVPKSSPKKTPVAPPTAQTTVTPTENIGCGPFSLDYCDRVIRNTSYRYGVDPHLVRAVVKAESNYNPTAVSKKGAQGMMQLMPETASDLAVGNVFDVEENVDGGVRYLRYLLGRFKNNTHLAVAAYNAGPAAVDKYGGTPPYAETQHYVRKVLKQYERLKGGRDSAPTIYRIVRPDGSLLFTNTPSDYTGSGEQKQGQEL